MARKENNFEVRTDLAVEQRESFPGDGGEIAGVALREWRESGSAVKMSEVQILDEHGARAMGKPKGVYLTLEADGMAGNDEEEMEEIAREFALQLRRLLLREQNEAQITPKELDDLKEFQGSKSEKVKNKENRTGFEGKRILVVGLGNAFVTPDALGPRTAGKLKVTRHLDGQFGKGFCQERNLPLLSAIVPGVMAQTGMESAEILRGIVRETKPELACSPQCPSPWNDDSVDGHRNSSGIGSGKSSSWIDKRKSWSSGVCGWSPDRRRCDFDCA